jgi:hypothetical protein
MYSINHNGLSAIFISLVLLFCMVAPSAASAQVLAGKTGSSPQWGSGWLDLAPPPVDFAGGEHLKLVIGGSADRILVRLLPQGGDPDKAIGLIPGVIDVPRSRIVEITLPEARRQVVQISVHGGHNAWNHSLGDRNGPATIISAERLRPN